MSKWIVGLIIDKVIKYIYQLISDWLEHRRATQRAKRKVKAIMKEHKDDPKARASAMRDFLNH